MQAFDFTEKVAIVTGGGGGIGRAASITLSEYGAKVVVVDLSEEAGMITVNEIKEKGGEAIFDKADVTNEEDIKNYVQKTIDSYGKIDIFLNNAGWEGKIMPLVDYPTEVFDQLMSINVRGVFLGLKHVLPYMIEQKSGAVVMNTASGAGLLATPNMVAYGASKHAVLGMTKTAGVEVAPHGVRVNAVCPGVVNTAMMRSIESGFGQGDSAAAETARKQLEATTPDGRYAEPQEIANLMMYLVSDLSSHITGQELVIDGGAILI
ncbi:glucose 1-dehydrogenase [Peribacillus simplex]|uniref:SDR family NAD(P)-dependent oxidoreductase n=2 Tax=Peribacillus simplex TaxID=1478 RepID=UPI003262F26B